MSLLLYGILRAIARTRSEARGPRPKATRELRMQLLFTQQLIEAMPEPVFYKDAEGRYLGCNRAFEEWIGVPRESHDRQDLPFDIAPADIAAPLATPTTRSCSSSRHPGPTKRTRGRSARRHASAT